MLPEGASNRQFQSVRFSALDVPLMASAQKSVDIRSSLQYMTRLPSRDGYWCFHDNKQVFSDLVTLRPGEERLIVASSDPTQDADPGNKNGFEPSN